MGRRLSPPPWATVEEVEAWVRDGERCRLWGLYIPLAVVAVVWCVYVGGKAVQTWMEVAP